MLFNANNSDWILDLRATSHLTADTSQIHNAKAKVGPQQISIGNGELLSITNSGQGILPTPNHKLLQKSHFHVPNISHDLISAHKLTSNNNYSITFDPSEFTIKDLMTNHTLLQGPSRYGLNQTNPPQSQYKLTAFTNSLTLSTLLHRQLGQHSPLVQHQLCTSPTARSSIAAHCPSYATSKSHKLPFSSSLSKSPTPL